MVFKIVALGLMAIFYCCYFAKMFSQRKQGINTDQLGKGKEGFVKWIEVSLKTVTYIVPVMQVVSILFWKAEKASPLQIVGIAVEALGVLIFVISVLEMKDNWRAGVQKEKKTDLVTTGIYSVSRNPAFLGFDLMYIGILLAFFNWILLVVTLFAVLLFHLQIVNVEEDFLIEVFGQEYLAYKNKVFRYFGRKFWKK